MDNDHTGATTIHSNDSGTPEQKDRRVRDQNDAPASSSKSTVATLRTSTTSDGIPSIWLRCCAGSIWLIKDQWFLLALGCLILISSQVQVPASHQNKKEIVVTYLCVAVIFIVTGCTLPTRVLFENYQRWKIHAFVQTQSFLMTSAIIYAVVSLCATNPHFMDPGLLIGLVFTGCVPTTISSNVVMTRQAHGNQALTVVQSTLGNLVAPFLTPALIEMYTSSGAWYTAILPRTTDGEFGQIYRRVFKQLGLSIFLPLAIGQIIQNVFPKTTRKVLIEWRLNKLSSFSLLIIVWQTYDQAFESGAFTSVPGSNMVFIVFISIAFYAIFTTVCVLLSLPWLKKKDTIAVAYCVPAKTPAMGVPMSVVMFVALSPRTLSKIQIPMVIFQGFQIAAGSLMTIAFRKWVQPDEEREAAAHSREENIEEQKSFEQTEACQEV